MLANGGESSKETGNGRNYDAAPDRRGFFIMQKDQPAASTEMRLVLNWFDELARHVPSGSKFEIEIGKVKHERQEK